MSALLLFTTSDNPLGIVKAAVLTSGYGKNDNIQKQQIKPEGDT